MPPRAGPTEQSPNNDMILGELRGQVRELVHGVNNLSGKFDALTREVIALGPLGAELAEMKAKIAKLEEGSNKQTGGYDVVKLLLNSPVVLSLLMGTAFMIAVFKGWFR